MSTLSQATGIDAGALEDLLSEGAAEAGAGGGTLLRPRVIPGASVAAPAPSVDLPAPVDATAHAGTLPSHGTLRAVDARGGTTLAGVALAAASGAAVTYPAASADSTPDFAAVLRHLNRSLRTAAPLLAADVAALVLAGCFAQLLLAILGLDVSPVLGRWAALALVPLVVGYWQAGLYAEVWVHPALELRQATHVGTVALAAAALGGYFAPPLSVWCAAAWPAVVCLVPLARAAARRCCRGRAWWGFPTLVIGSGDAADRMARLLMRSPGCGLRPVLLTDPDSQCRASIVPVMNDPAVLRSIVRARGIRHAVLMATDESTAKLARLFDRYGELASHLLVVCDAPPMPALWGAQRVCGLGGVEVRNGLLLAPLRVVKRVTDVCLASLAMVVGVPLLLAIALAVKLSSSGPVLYGHTRIGRYGRKFTAWKFRTMYRGADVLLRQHLDRFPAARREWERDQKLRNDPRVTRVGHVLRRLSLDELPQLWNVLRGEMSVVGPRPIVDDEVAKYAEAFGLYTVVKPGITGLWQVSGRTDVGYETRVKLDEFYVRHWSPWLDAYVLVRTVVALLRRKGAY